MGNKMITQRPTYLQTVQNLFFVCALFTLTGMAAFEAIEPNPLFWMLYGWSVYPVLAEVWLILFHIFY